MSWVSECVLSPVHTEAQTDLVPQIQTGAVGKIRGTLSTLMVLSVFLRWPRSRLCEVGMRALRVLLFGWYALSK